LLKATFGKRIELLSHTSGTETISHQTSQYYLFVDLDAAQNGTVLGLSTWKYLQVSVGKELIFEAREKEGE
jgi:hypothetical protein